MRVKTSFPFTQHLSFLSVFSLLLGGATSAAYAATASAAPDKDIGDLGRTVSKIKISQKEKQPRQLRFERTDGGEKVRYTQRLSITVDDLSEEERSLDLSRENDTFVEIGEVIKASAADGGKTHLRAQGVYMSATHSWSKLFREKIFLGLTNTAQPIHWVSKESAAVDKADYVVRKPQTNYFGGHAEPQFIRDFQDAFTQTPDAVISLFTPSNTKTNVYMCGLELFGPHDMCDAYQQGGQNQYNCVGALRKLRSDHQSGQQSISQAIRDKLKDRFKSADEDAFVVIYHAAMPYQNVTGYKAVDIHDTQPLGFKSSPAAVFEADIDDAASFGDITLSQQKRVDVQANKLYGYIHSIGERALPYKDGAFSFN